MKATEAKKEARRALRIVSRCATQAEFVAIFRGLCDERSVFIATSQPKEPGTELRFQVTLAGGQPMLAGRGRVIEVFTHRDNAWSRPGMRIEFVELDPASRRIHARLLAPIPALPPMPKALPNRRPPPVRGSGSMPLPRAPGLGPAPAPTSPAAAPPIGESRAALDPEAAAAERRAPGSDYILPANPFGELAPEMLEAFVECTLYEETGTSTAVPPADEPEPADAPAWWPSPAPDPIPPTEHSPIAEPPAVAPPPMAYAPVMTARAPSPTELVRIDTPWQRHRTAIIAGLAASVTLIASYAFWAGDSAADPPLAPRSSAFAPLAQPSSPSDAGPKVDTPTASPSDAAPMAVAADAAPMAVAADAAPVAAAAALPVPADGCRLALESQPEGATVSLGRKTLGTTPAEVEIACGEHRLRFQRARYAPAEVEVQAKPGQLASARAVLERPMHLLDVDTKPHKATVYLAGRKVGVTPLKTKVTGFERTSVKLVLPGYKPWSKQVYASKKTTKLRVRLGKKR